jgi:hypothetical protein
MSDIRLIDMEYAKPGRIAHGHPALAGCAIMVRLSCVAHRLQAGVARART